jgi:hypothetical protein
MCLIIRFNNDHYEIEKSRIHNKYNSLLTRLKHLKWLRRDQEQEEPQQQPQQQPKPLTLPTYEDIFVQVEEDLESRPCKECDNSHHMY